MTALKQAFEAAGYQSAADRLREIAVKAWATSPRIDGARDFVFAAIRSDAGLLWELFAAQRSAAVDQLLRAVAEDARRSRGGGQVPSEYRNADAPSNPIRSAPSGAERREGQVDSDRHIAIAIPKNPPPRDRSAAAGAEVAGNVARLSLLDTFRANGRAIGDLTAAEAKGWAGARERDARFVRLLTQNLPDDLPIRRFRTGEEAAVLYEQAKKVPE